MGILGIGDVEVDLDAREIRRRGVDVVVQPRIFDLLRYLIEHRERIVTKAELLESLWAGQVVVPDVLTTAFYTLRRALQDNPKQPIYIRTIHGVGYQLIADVRTDSPNHPRFPALEVRHASFVGRQAQKKLFDEMLAGSSNTQLLFLHGPPGIGKTTLLQELVFQCRNAATQHVWLSGRGVDGRFEDALARALGCEEASAIDHLTTRSSPLVIFIDDAQLLPAADEWLRQELWPALPSFVRLIIAGHHAPSARWRCDPAWLHTAHTIELHGLTIDEARALFSARGSTKNVETMWACTRGHPLALTLAADIASPEEEISGHADIIDTLIHWFTDQIFAAPRKRAFEIASVFDAVSERLLIACDVTEAPSECIEWLSTLPFVERDLASPPGTLRVHALVRDAVVARLGRTDPSRLADLVESGCGYYFDELQRSDDPSIKLRAVQQYVGLGRHHPAMRANYTASDNGPESTVQPAAPRELSYLLDLVKQHEGVRSMEMTKRWLEHPMTVVLSVRDDSDVPAGFLVTLRLSTGDQQAAFDPIVSSILRFIGQQSEDGDEEIIIHRTLLARDDYQAPSAVMKQVHVAKTFAFMWHGMHSPTIAHVVSVYGEPDTWEESVKAVGFARLRGLEVELGSRRFAAFHHSLRKTPVDKWLTETGQRLVSAIREAHA